MKTDFQILAANFNFMRFINVPVFLASFVFGLIAVYITVDDTRRIFVYPTPDNVAAIQYRDKAGTCFDFKSKGVKCPTNSWDISKIPAQA
jgi:hypothetical protein